MSASALFPVSPLLAERLAGTPLVVLLDVDGTLAPIVERHDAATVPVETRRAVAALATRRGVYVALVSGRAAADARRMVSVSGAWVIGNHGYEITGPDGEELVDPEVSSYRGAVAQAARRIAPLVAPVHGVILEDKGWTLTIHYRLAPAGVVPRLRDLVSGVAGQLGLRVTEGKMVLEVRPPARVHKGTAILALGLRLGAFGEGASVIFVGDDVTDEDGFRALRLRSPRAVTVRVAHGTAEPTAAEFAVRDTDDVRAFLEWLLEQRSPAAR